MLVSCRARKTFFATLSLLLSLLLPTSCQKHSDGEITRLSFPSILSKTLPPGARHLYRFDLTAQQYFRVLIEHSGIRLRVNLYSPEGQVMQTLHALEPGTLPGSAIAAQTGSYRLEIQSLEPGDDVGSYRIQLVEPRLARPEDNQRIEADAAFAQAEQHRTTATRTAWLTAQTAYQTAQKLWLSLGEKHEAALVLQRLGELQQQLGEESAVDSWQQALSLCSAEEELWLILQNQLFSLNRTDEGQCQQWLEQSRARNFKRSAALALENLGELAYANQPRLARQYQSQALAIWRTLQDRRKQASALYYLGSISALLTETSQAVEEYSAALALYREVNDKPGIAATLSSWGHQQNVLGHKQSALQLYEEALQEAEDFGDQVRRISIYNGKGFVYDSFGEYANALKLYEQAGQIAQQIHDERSQAGALLNMGDMHRQLGQPQQALSYLQLAWGLIQKLNQQSYRQPALLNLGLTYEALGDKAQALESLQAAAELSQQSQSLRGAALVRNEIGRIYRTEQRLPEARQQHTQALQFSQEAGDPFGEAQSRYYLARVEQAAGQTMEAITHIQEAVALIEKSRTEVIAPSLRVSYLASVHQSYELNVDLLMQRHQETGNLQFALEALTRSEQSRARSLLDLLNEARHNLKQEADTKLLTQQQSLLQERNRKADRKLQGLGNPDKAAEVEQLTRELETINTQLNELDWKTRSQNSDYTALPPSQPINAQQMQQLLNDDTLLLEFALGEERSYLWAVTRTTLTAYRLPKRAILEPLVRELYNYLTAPPLREGETAAQWHQRITQANQQYWPRAAALSQMLLGSVAAQLGRQRLIIVGDGALQLLPFAALPEPTLAAETPLQPLIVNHEITSLPSASSLQALRTEQAQRLEAGGWWARWTRRFGSWFGANTRRSVYAVAMLADPVFSKDDKRVTGQGAAAKTAGSASLRDINLSDENLPLPRLIATREEAEEIRKVAGASPFLLKHGFEANRSVLEGKTLQDYNVLHFATHGFWDSTNPELSCLFFSRFDQQGNKIDGTLRLSDIYNLKLPKELIVLSACETALGKDIRGEGLMALTRGFMYAGATRVMASLWKVEDSATAEMMKRFYYHLLQDQLSPAAALRQAQLDYWRKDPTQVPYHWAAFVLQGEYR